MKTMIAKFLAWFPKKRLCDLCKEKKPYRVEMMTEAGIFYCRSCDERRRNQSKCICPICDP